MMQLAKTSKVHNANINVFKCGLQKLSVNCNVRQLRVNWNQQHVKS